MTIAPPTTAARPARTATLAASIATRPFDDGALPPIDRHDAELAVLDITKWFGEASGGVKTYLQAKMRYVQAHPALRHALVIPGGRDQVEVHSGTRTYRLRGPFIPTQQAYRFLLAPRTTRRIVRHERPDVIEVGSPFAVPWLTAFAARGLGIPLVLFHHSSLAGTMRSAPGRRVAARYARQLSRLFHAIVVASDFAGDELRNAGVERIVRIPLGVDLQRFRPASPFQRVMTRTRLALPTDRIVALYVGRLAPEKRLEVLLDAWPEIARRTGAHLAIVGDGAERDALRARSRSAHVSWFPYLADRDDVAQLHAAVDVYVSPGPVETFGLAPLEAMACGVPVLSVASGGVAELVARSGGGRLYAEDSPSSLVDRFQQLLADGLRHAGSRARAYAVAEHDWELVFDRLFALHREVALR